MRAHAEKLTWVQRNRQDLQGKEEIQSKLTCQSCCAELIYPGLSQNVGFNKLLCE